MVGVFPTDQRDQFPAKVNSHRLRREAGVASLTKGSDEPLLVFKTQEDDASLL